MLVVPALLAISGCRAPQAAPAPAPALGLFTSLPILWDEAASATDLLRGDAPPHWARTVLDRHGTLRPLDTLAELDGVTLLVMAQPRPLSPQENVALDRWVRGGGRVLLFADPMLTSHSAYGLGDRRRPQDVVLLSPILARWGLDLQFDEDQPAGARQAALLGATVPVDLPGRFALAPGARGCRLEAAGLAARCRIGRGQVLALADAALLDAADPAGDEARAAALDRLLEALATGS